MAPSGTVQYSTVWFTKISVPVSKFVNSIKIANRIVPVFWDPSAGVPSRVIRYLKSVPYCNILTCTAQWKLAITDSSLTLNKTNGRMFITINYW